MAAIGEFVLRLRGWAARRGGATALRGEETVTSGEVCTGWAGCTPDHVRLYLEYWHVLLLF